MAGIKIKKIREGFDSFLEKRIVPLDKKIIMVIFAVIIILPVVTFYFLYFTAQTQEIKKLESKTTKLRK